MMTGHWRIKKLDQDSYEGVTDGVIGTARGRVCGQAFQWQYRFRLRVGNRYINVKFNDCTSATLVGEATGFSKNN